VFVFLIFPVGLWVIFIFHHAIILCGIVVSFYGIVCPSLFLCMKYFILKATRQIREAGFRLIGTKSHMMLKPECEIFCRI
jgi:hypothetical protein